MSARDEAIFGDEVINYGPQKGFSETPLWIVVAARKSVWLYDYLRARYGGLPGGIFPGLSTIAEDLKVSESTVRRACDELEKVGAFEVEPRFTDDGRQTTNLYVTHFYPPGHELRPPSQK